LKEAEITCLCLSIRLADLDLPLFKGQTVYVDAERAKGSKDLEMARRGNGVRVRYVERCVEYRKPEPSPNSRVRIRHPVPAVPVRPPQPASDFDVGALAKHLRDQLEGFVGHPLKPASDFDVGALAKQLRDQLEGFVGHPLNTEQTRKIIREEITSALGPMLESLVRPLQTISQDLKSGRVRGQEDGLVFIPDQILGGADIQADISVDQDEADSDSVDAAVKALKAAKKAKK